MPTNRREFYRSALLGGTAILLVGTVMGTGSIALAQDQNDGAGEAVEEVIVTGSRIKRAGFDTLEPAIQVDSEFMDDRGFTNVAQALNEVPAFGLPGATNYGGQKTSNVGANFVNAFGLGSQRTLTLINGRRVVGQNTPAAAGGALGGAPSGLQVDLNIIPTALVDRVETIFVGGSPVYGSDAVAGTVNVILKDNYEGVETDVQFGISERGDAENFRVRGLFGGNFSDGRGNAVVTAEFVTVKSLPGTGRQRALDGYRFCANPDNTGPDDGIADNLLCKDGMNVWQMPNSGLPVADPDIISGLVFPAGGAILNAVYDADGNALMYNAQGDLVTFAEAGVGDPYHVIFAQGSGCGTNALITCTPETNSLISPLDRWNISGNAHYGVTEDVQFFVETLYSETKAVDTNNQPPWSVRLFAPGAMGPVVINLNDNPFVKQQTLDIYEANGLYDPALSDGDIFTSDDNQLLFMNRSNIDIVDGRETTRMQNVVRMVAGLRGEFDVMNKPWDWEVYYSYGATHGLARLTAFNGIRYGLALDAVVDPDSGEIVCRVKIDPPDLPQGNSQYPAATPSDYTDCIPFNPFGVDQNSQEAIDYLLQGQLLSNEIRQQVMAGYLSGELFDLPAGPVAFAGGFEHRREDGQFSVDQASEIGIDVTRPVPNVAGSFKTYEAYGEFLLPIIENGEGLPLSIPGIKSLSAEAAFRWVDNNRAGQDLTWRAGGRMRLDLPVLGDALMLRGNYTQTIRSPSIVELFLPQSFQFTRANDPCDPRFLDGGPNPAVRRANCEAEFAAALSGIIDPGLTSLNDFVSLIVNAAQPSTSGGNPELENEVGNSFTVGAILSPHQVPGLTVSVDWTSIRLNNAITQISATQLLNACYDSVDYPSADECGNFLRDSTNFQVRDPQLGFANAAVREYSGLIANLTYRTDVENLPFLSGLPGVLDLSGSFFYTKKHEQSVGGEDFDDFAGEEGFEKVRFQLNLRYTLDELSVLWQLRHTGGGYFSNEDSAEFRDHPRFPSNRIHSMTINYNFNESLRARFIVNNIFDNIDKPLLAASAGENNLNQFNDIVGRRFTLGLSSSF